MLPQALIKKTPDGFALSSFVCLRHRKSYRYTPLCSKAAFLVAKSTQCSPQSSARNVSRGWCPTDPPDFCGISLSGKKVRQNFIASLVITRGFEESEAMGKLSRFVWMVFIIFQSENICQILSCLKGQFSTIERRSSRIIVGGITTLIQKGEASTWYNDR